MKQFKVMMVDESGMLDESVEIVKAIDIDEAIKQYQETNEINFEMSKDDLGKRIYKLSEDGYSFYFIECKFI